MRLGAKKIRPASSRWFERFVSERLPPLPEVARPGAHSLPDGDRDFVDWGIERWSEERPTTLDLSSIAVVGRDIYLSFEDGTASS